MASTSVWVARLLANVLVFLMLNNAKRHNSENMATEKVAHQSQSQDVKQPWLEQETRCQCCNNLDLLGKCSARDAPTREKREKDAVADSNK